MSKGIKEAIQQLDTEIAYHLLMNDVPVDNFYVELGERMNSAKTKDELARIYNGLVDCANLLGIKVKPFHQKASQKKSFWGDYGSKRAKKIVRYLRIGLTAIWIMTWITLFILSATVSNWEEHEGEEDYLCPFAAWGLMGLIVGGVSVLMANIIGGDELLDHLEQKYSKLRRRKTEDKGTYLVDMLIIEDTNAIINKGQSYA